MTESHPLLTVETVVLIGVGDFAGANLAGALAAIGLAWGLVTLLAL